jgi:hypothetical protein
MNLQQMKRATTSDSSDQPVQPNAQDQTGQPVSIEVRWNIPAWMMRDQGPEVPVEDDDLQEGE